MVGRLPVVSAGGCGHCWICMCGLFVAAWQRAGSLCACVRYLPLQCSSCWGIKCLRAAGVLVCLCSALHMRLGTSCCSVAGCMYIPSGMARLLCAVLYLHHGPHLLCVPLGHVLYWKCFV